MNKRMFVCLTLTACFIATECNAAGQPADSAKVAAPKAAATKAAATDIAATDIAATDIATTDIATTDIATTDVAARDVALGNLLYADCMPASKVTDFQDDPRLTWDMIGNLSLFRYRRPGVTTIFQNFIAHGKFSMTDFVQVQSRFDLAAKHKDQYDYGVFLLMEELFHPSLLASWFSGTCGMNTWTIAGKTSFAGVEVKLFKTWYIENKGPWTEAVQKWWLARVAANDCYDKTVMAWSVEYGYGLYKAWHQHMRNLGKKSAVLGLVGPNDGDFVQAFDNSYFPGQLGKYVTQNYDLVFSYRYPRTLKAIAVTANDVKQLRLRYKYKGKIAYIPTSWFSNHKWEWSEKIAYEEFKAVYPYVDIFMPFPYAHMDWKNPSIPYPPLMIEFQDRLRAEATKAAKDASPAGN